MQHIIRYKKIIVPKISPGCRVYSQLKVYNALIDLARTALIVHVNILEYSLVTVLLWLCVVYKYRYRLI